MLKLSKIMVKWRLPVLTIINIKNVDTDYIYLSLFYGYHYLCHLYSNSNNIFIFFHVKDYESYPTYYIFKATLMQQIFYFIQLPNITT